MEEPEIFEKKKIFFITSNQIGINSYIQYEIGNNKGIANLKSGNSNAEMIEEIEKNGKYSVYINSIEINSKDLNKQDIDKKTKKYKVEINLKYENKKFLGYINFDLLKNNSFLYDFTFDECEELGKTISPPLQIKLTKLEQLKLYIKFLKDILKKDKNDQIYKNLIADSKFIYFGQNVDLDSILEIIRICNGENLKIVFNELKLENILFSDNFDYKNYESYLNRIDKNSIITELNDKKICNEFYILLFIIFCHYNQEKAIDILENKKEDKNFFDGLNRYTSKKEELFFYFDELSQKILDQDMKVEKINIIFKIYDSLEKILVFINDYNEDISNCYFEEKKIILISSFVVPKKNDNFEKIIREIEKIIIYENNTNKFFISFDHEFWNKFILLIDDIKKLYIINKTIILCSAIDKQLNCKNINIMEKIHKKGIEFILNNSLKNEELIRFLNNDIYFSNDDYSNIKDRPLDIIQGLDFDTMKDEFFKMWKKFNILKKYSFCENDFNNRIIDKVTDIKHFGKLLKLFDSKDKYIFNDKLIQKLKEKFITLIPTYKKETCPKFEEEIEYFIHIIDYLKKSGYDSLHFQMINDIYINLSNNYKDISEKIIEKIIDFWAKNSRSLNIEKLLLLIKNIKCKKVIISLLNKIENFAVKQEELFNQEKNNESFVLLDEINKCGLFEKLKNDDDFRKTKYLIKIFRVRENILKIIKNGEIYYNTFKAIYSSIEKRYIFKEKLKILLFNNREEIEQNMNILIKNYNEINKVLRYINLLKSILKEPYEKEPYESEHLDNIKKVEKLENLIKSNMMNEIERQNVKNIIEEIYKILPQNDLDKIYKLNDSIFFRQLLRLSKSKNHKQNIEEAEINFNKLRLLFESPNWMNEIPENILKECIKCLKEQKKEAMIEELKKLLKIFQIEGLDEEFELANLEDSLRKLIQKEEIFSTVDGCINFIDEVKAKKTDFYEELQKIKRNLKSNLSFEKIQNFGNNLEQIGLKVLYPLKEDRNYLDILWYTLNNKHSIEFLFDINYYDIMLFKKSVKDYYCLGNEDIEDMIKCYKFVYNLCKIKGEKTDKVLINDFIKFASKEKDISNNFKKYTGKFRRIQFWISDWRCRPIFEEAVKCIMNNSFFILFLDNNKEQYIKFEGKYMKYEDDERKIDFDYIIHHLRKISKSKRNLLDVDEFVEMKVICDTYKLFEEIVNEIENIYDLLKKIGEKGFTENIKIKININNKNPTFYFNEAIINNYEECRKYLYDLYNKIKEIHYKYYIKEELIRYIYGRQFNLLNSCLKKMNEKDLLLSFLKFVTNDKIGGNEILKELEYDYDYGKNEDKYICLFENIIIFLSNILKRRNLEMKTIYKENMVKEKYMKDFVGLFTYFSGKEKNYEIEIINLFNLITGNPPMAQAILLCNEETTKEEITAFLYRAILCQYNVFFLIGNIEILTLEKNEIIINLIHKLLTEKKNELKSFIVFIYHDKENISVKELLKINGIISLNNKNIKLDDQKLYEENIEIISSDKSGVGKSTQIKLKVKAEKKNYIYFPVCGILNRMDIINRLNKIQKQIINEDKTVVHLDLYDTNKTEIMNEFLSIILFTKFFVQNYNFFYLSKKIKIYIEIPNGIINFFDKFPILNLFKNKTEMKITNLPPLIIKKELNSNIQIVCNYLKLVYNKKLSENDLIIKDFSLSRDDLKEMFDNCEFKDDRILDEVYLDEKECDALIKYSIKKFFKIQYPNYYQINLFINILSGQLKNFSNNYYLTATNLIQTEIILKEPNLRYLRDFTINSFKINTINFILGMSEEIKQVQKDTYIYIQKYNDENIKKEKTMITLCEPKSIISFDKIKTALIFFNEGDSQNFTIIIKDKPDKDEYDKLLKLIKSLTKVRNIILSLNNIKEKEFEVKELKSYTKFTHEKLLAEIKQILTLNNPIYTYDKYGIINLKPMEEIIGNYIFTPDNFIKMILLLIRIRENIPIIIMGEAGCGKTSLIIKLSELLNNGENKVEIFNFHAGITEEDIIKFLFDEKEIDGVKYDSIIEKAKNLENAEEKKYKSFKRIGMKYSKKKLWVLFEHFNTCNYIGLIEEIMIKHTCQGIELPENILFIGACNPYRYRTKNEDNSGLKLIDYNLVYRVNPLPFSLINFVLNFGYPILEDEKNYINNIINLYFEKSFFNEKDLENKDNKKNIKKNQNKEEYELCEELKKLSIKAIIEGQNYIREKYGVSSVSLRTISHFCTLFDFFIGYFRNKNKLSGELGIKEILNKEIYINSIKLSIYLCYYIRLSKMDLREEFTLKINKIFGDNFIEIAKEEQKFICSNIVMEKGIAINRVLLENIFTMFTCVNAKVPLYIIGKSGYSKSLSENLVFKLMKGDASDNPFIKAFPKLYINFYQVSLKSSSQGILKVLKRAKQILRSTCKPNEIISMIYLDKIENTELSPNNPLEVINYELETIPREKEKKISFVGISNFILENSIMNGGLILSIPPLDKKELEIIALSIAESYDEKLVQDNKDLFISLANSYFEYKEILQKKYKKNEEFHGLNDFYQLIKTAMKYLIKAREDYIDINESIKQEIGVKIIERNFAGFEFNTGNLTNITSFEIIENIFKKRFIDFNEFKNYDIIQNIYENIKDNDSRYLLLIYNSSTYKYMILNFILNSKEFKKNSDKGISFYINNVLTRNIQSDLYNNKFLEKIIYEMEKNKLFIFIDLEQIYQSLIGFFSKDYIVVSGKRYVRVGIGDNYTFSVVNEQMKCIVLVKEEEIKKLSPSFLSCFEKHVLSFKYLLNEKLRQEADKIYEEIKDYIKQCIKENKLLSSLNNNFINLDKEEIQSLLFIKMKEYQSLGKNILAQDIMDFILEKISLILPREIILLLKNLNFEEKYKKINEKIINCYHKGKHENLFEFLKKIKKTKNIIYTYTSINNPLIANIKDNFEIEKLGKINKQNIKEIYALSLDSEDELEEELDKIYSEKENEIKIIIFKFPYDTKIINYITLLLENYLKEKNYIHDKKVYIFSIHVNKILEDKERQTTEKISLLIDFYQIFIDYLNEGDFQCIQSI